MQFEYVNLGEKSNEELEITTVVEDSPGVLWIATQGLSNSSTSPAATPLAQIAETSRDCVDAMSDIVWAINPQRDHLTDLTHRMRRFAEDLFDAKEIDFTIQSALDEKDVRLGSELRREVYLIFKECVNNPVKHADCRRAPGYGWNQRHPNIKGALSGFTHLDAHGLRR